VDNGSCVISENAFFPYLFHLWPHLFWSAETVAAPVYNNNDHPVVCHNELLIGAMYWEMGLFTSLLLLPLVFQVTVCFGLYKAFAGMVLNERAVPVLANRWRGWRNSLAQT
jgi:hypothetical protein